MENYFRFDNPNSLGFPFDNGYLNSEPPFHRNPHTIEDFASRNLPLFPVSGLHFKPHFDQAYAPVFDSAPKEKFPTSREEVFEKGPTIGAQKRFLVFDQSGDKTTLLYTSGAHDSVQFGASRFPNLPPTALNLKEQRGIIDHLSLNEENVEDYGTEDEMHENTEELDALLCSDDDSDYSEDEETSTGHSPSTMTDNGIPNLVEEMGEEVDSFSLPTKRQKLSDGGYEKTSALESDAESSSGNGRDSWSGCKRLRKEKIHETVSILQSIVPNANGKDTVVVIDEAICFLKSLKVKAMALGLDSN